MFFFNLKNLLMLIMVFSGCCLRSVFATDFNYIGAIRYATYKNIHQEPDPVDTESSESIYMEFSVVEDTSILNASFFASVEAINYVNDYMNDQVVNNLSIDSLWRIRPEHLEWQLLDVYTQAAIDSDLPGTPDNQQDVNAFITGPEYYLRFDSSNTLNIDLKYMDFYFEDIDIDNSRSLAALNYIHIINSAITINTEYTYQNTIFDNDRINTNYGQQELIAGLAYDGRSTTTQFEIGAAYILPDNSAKTTETIYSLTTERQVTVSSILSIEISHQVSDVGLSLFDMAPNQPAAMNILDVNSGIYFQDMYVFGYSKQVRNGDYLVNIAYVENNYPVVTLSNVVEMSALFGRNWDLPRGASLALSLTYTDMEYENMNPIRLDDIALFRAEYSYNARRNIDLNIEVITEKQTSNIEQYNFEDVRMLFSLEYSTR
ncbi:MAG: hypothetical protein OEZ38_03930 [Gammaproteobacteria bacterium]|nr:hypothetical protein [Gammaproteobacteria bacterium]